MRRFLMLLTVSVIVGLLMLTLAVPAFADGEVGPPGPGDTSIIPNEEPDANITGHDESCDAQAANLTSEPGASGETPSHDALVTANETQCE